MRCTIALGLLFLACGTSPWPGHKRVGPETYLRLCELGDGQREPNDSDHVQLHIRAAPMGDEPGAALSGEFQVAWEGILGSGLASGIARMHEGDSAEMIMPVHAFPWSGFEVDAPMTDTLITIRLRLVRLISRAELRAEQAAFDAWREDKELEEQALLLRWLRANGVDSVHQAWPGIHHVEISPGKGERLRTGDVVSIHFRSTLLDGTLVEDTERTGEAFKFRIGDPEQVIQGLDAALRRMRPGGEAQVVIPSQFAFGHTGAGGGIVPPFSTLVYRVRVLQRHDGPA